MANAIAEKSIRHGYRPDWAEYQVNILKHTPIPATLFAVVKSGERFNIPVHPKYR